MKTQQKLKMKNLILLALVIALIAGGCQKEEIEENEILEEYCTESINGNFDAEVKIDGKDYAFHGGTSYFFTEPEIKYPNQFSFYVVDTTQSVFRSLRFDIPIDDSNPNNFFKEGIFKSNYIQIEYFIRIESGLVDYNGFYENADVEFIWHEVSFENDRFKGKGSLVIKDSLGPLPNLSYVVSPQVINVEF
ncbi:hypothetical protein [Draconibacterium mangrovi]|uniref:hypothetical protein n=1 Tax=Draconibacterium mangrovi TaxID=2697469 RepID=UPI0013D0DF56|nr:hypothetical protein [Draconibacterium mangrovi]